MADEDELVAARYRLRDRIGQGAMGVVWRAEDETLRRPVALKQVLLPSGADAEALAQAHRRVMREGRMIARLHHPHAIALYDVVEDDEAPWLVMEYLPSRSLAEVLAQDGPLHPDATARLGRQVADALAAAHDAGIVHRDVKPGNVLIDEAGTVKVTDFGIARAVDDVTITSTGRVAGTPAYLAPEVARGAAADFRSDVFSLGSTLYAATEGGPPFGAGDNALAVLHRVAGGEHAPARHAGPLAPLLGGMLQAEPDRRLPMSRVRDELAALVSGSAGTEEGPVTPILPRPAAGSAPSSSPDVSVREPVPDPAPEQPVAVAAPVATAPGPAPVLRPPPGSPPPDHVAVPGRPPADTDEARHPARRRWPYAVAGLAVVLVGAVVVVALLGTGAGSGARVPSDAGSTPETSSATGSGGDAATASPALTGSADDRARQQAVVDYYALLPDRLDEGWQRLTPSFQQSTAGGLENYRSFWGSVQEVAVLDVSPAGGDAVDATVSYRYADGRAVRERTVFGLVLQDGVWKIDSQRQD
ncbi:serine/threonine protein kinase [Actinomycetospora sp. NBRC 106375]|uniref:serine/threonine-protein kinase n=1 Tax=Actinomycetospora sp. NBRC 106375 TaxID=3032207 RepID=UPI0024A41B38|nr:serine/threonine-protein kinase [Actinomycetospora sp. NBRC 106375]GLZ47005.1 serine/threonine protein kinase [Actinomycetospora sp. NBRC 106375]